MDRAAVAAYLGAAAQGEEAEPYEAWLDDLEKADLPSPEVAPPSGAELDELVRRLGIHEDDALELAETRPTPTDDPELWWLLQRVHSAITSNIGDLDFDWRRDAHLPKALGPKARFFYAHVLLASVPKIRAWHRQRGIPDDTSWATLADLGRQIAIYRRIHGVGGLDVQFWFTLHFRGLIYDFGRLQLNRGVISYTELQIEQAKAPFKKGDPALGVHIPESGRMTPQACDESIRLAKEFYATYFPDEPYKYAVCSSWLLDPQLADYLPENSNIVHFLRRFTLVPGGYNGDKDVFQFVFRAVDPVLDELPQRTTLERAIVQHLKAGKRWEIRTGWFAL